MHASDLVLDFLDTVRRKTGSAHASVALHMEPLELQTMMLCNCGEGNAVPELADQTAAWDFISRHESDGVANQYVDVLPSTAPDGMLIRVAFSSILEQRRSGRRNVDERRRDPDINTAPPWDGAIWIGLTGATYPERLLEELAPETLGADAAASAACSLTEVCARLVWSVYHLTYLLPDAVSRLPGRMELQVFLKRVLAAVRRTEQAIGLMLVNPDDFTMINVRYGRRQGDQTVRKIAELLDGCLRHTDGVFHYGGAVFAAVLPATNIDQCRAAAEKVRNRLSSSRYVDNTVALTFSIGAAVATPEDIAGNQGIEFAISQRADAALNGARLSGGARIVLTDTSDDDNATGQPLRNPLSGIFAADTEKDYRNMLLLWETVALISTQTDPQSVATAFVDRLAIGFRPDRAALFSVAEGELETLASNVRDDSSADGRASGRAFELDDTRRKLVIEALETGRVARTRRDANGQAGFFAYAVPLIAHDVKPGCLYLDASGHRLQLDSSDVVFLNALASQMAVALDRAALAARWIREKDRESRKLREEVRELRQALNHDKMIYQSPAMHAVMETMRHVAPSDATVLIVGESGTGKEMLAQSLHELSNRRDRPFVVFDCGAVAHSLLESELFGHTKGAFTGAQSASIGRIAQADGGTLFLDEIGELPLELQAKLLRFVQEKEFSPVGGPGTRRVNVRIVAATNRLLQEEVGAGRFRADLYYRLRVIAVKAVPLRDRPEDILPLARYFLEKFAAQYSAPAHRLSSEAERKLIAYPWPGNIRELQNCILRAVLTQEADELTADAIELFPESSADGGRAKVAPPAVNDPALPPPMLRPVDGEKPTDADPWRELQLELERQVTTAFKQDHRRPVPIGRWLNEDLVLAASKRCNNIARRAAQLVGVPESTFRRQLDKANAGTQTGASFRSGAWASVRPLIRRVINDADAAGIPGINILERARDELLACVHLKAAARPGAGASLMGVTPPTYKRWLTAQEKVS